MGGLCASILRLQLSPGRGSHLVLTCPGGLRHTTRPRGGVTSQVSPHPLAAIAEGPPYPSGLPLPAGTDLGFCRAWLGLRNLAGQQVSPRAVGVWGPGQGRWRQSPRGAVLGEPSGLLGCRPSAGQCDMTQEGKRSQESLGPAYYPGPLTIGGGAGWCCWDPEVMSPFQPPLWHQPLQLASLQVGRWGWKQSPGSAVDGLGCRGWTAP